MSMSVKCLMRCHIKVPDTDSLLLSVVFCIIMYPNSDCIPCRGVRSPTKKGCPGYGTKLNQVVKFQFWSSGEHGVVLHCHYSQVHSDTEC